MSLHLYSAIAHQIAAVTAFRGPKVITSDDADWIASCVGCTLSDVQEVAYGLSVKIA